MRTHSCDRYPEIVLGRAYSPLLLPKRDRRWWHRFLPPKVKLHVCAKCGNPIRSLDARHYA